MNTWVNSRGIGSWLRFVIVPVLEDGNRGADVAGSGYQTLLDWAKPLLPATVQCRRSTTGVGARRTTNLPMKFHKADINGIVSGDVLTEDGVSISDADWIAVQKNAPGYSISGLFRWESFNGNRALGAAAVQAEFRLGGTSQGHPDRDARLMKRMVAFLILSAGLAMGQSNADLATSSLSEK
jgi:hypothetical protein